MGCGASSDPKVGVSDSIKPVNTKNANETSPSKNKHKSQYSDPRNLPDTNNVPAPLAFVISFDEENKKGEIKRPPPGRLRLEPLNNNRVTKGELDDKMRAAELNRERILAERVKSSSSKKRTPNHSNYNSDRYDSDTNFRDENKRHGMNGDYERDEGNKERLLKNKRIIRQLDDSDDFETERKYNNSKRQDEDYYDDRNDRRYK